MLTLLQIIQAYQYFLILLIPVQRRPVETVEKAQAKSRTSRARARARAKCVGIVERRVISNASFPKERMATLWRRSRVKEKEKVKRARKEKAITTEVMIKAKIIGIERRGKPWVKVV